MMNKQSERRIAPDPDFAKESVIRLSFHMRESSSASEIVVGLCLFFRSGQSLI